MLYCPKGQWRFAIYNEAGILNGFLADVPASASPEEAQTLLLNRVQEGTGLTYVATWTQDEAQWWSATLVASD